MSLTRHLARPVKRGAQERRAAGDRQEGRYDAFKDRACGAFFRSEFVGALAAQERGGLKFPDAHEAQRHREDDRAHDDLEEGSREEEA